jgi:hypothetical protein
MRLNPISQIKADLGIDVNGKVQKFFTDICAKHMEKYIPQDTLALITNVDKGSNYITYESEYAHYQYVNQFPEENYTTPGTGPYWDKRMVSAEMPIVVKEVQRYVNGR